jgi:hypothetical protein
MLNGAMVNRSPAKSRFNSGRLVLAQTDSAFTY